MTRVTENSNQASISYALNRTKKKLEDLQLKGATLKNISKPSDNPVSNVESLQLKSTKSDNIQYERNIDQANLVLNTLEQSLEEITEILNKAKEIAIAQSSDIYNPDVRKNVSHEVIQLRNQLIAIANTRSGNKYIFSGHKTLTPPFDKEGNYQGDEGIIELEISKDFFIPTNIPGNKVFFVQPTANRSAPKSTQQKHRADELIQEDDKIKKNSRDLASISPAQSTRPDSMFRILDNLITGLENDDSDVIKGTLERFDDALSQVITLRTKVGSLSNTLMASSSRLEKDNLDIDTRNSKLIDADIAELYSDLTRQKNILDTTYKASSNLMNKKLLDFLH